MGIKDMQPIERKLAKCLVDEALAFPGIRLSVWDGEEWACERSRDRREVLAALAHTDQDELLIYPDDHGPAMGWVLLIWGNGEDLISDCSVDDFTDRLTRRVSEMCGVI